VKTLAIDTSTDLLSVAVRTEEGVAEASLDLGLRHAEKLVDLVDICLTRAGIAAQDLDLVACAAGPGSFTGLRIGFSTAKGMALALGKPYVAVPTLDCLAWGLDFFPGAVLPVIDGKKGRLYTAIYEKGERRSDWLDISLEGLLPLLDTYSEVLVTGPDAELLEETALERGTMRMDGRARSSAARALAALAELKFRTGGGAGKEDGPLYLRPSEAEETAMGKAENAKGKSQEA
jgi:tRNA threonylcarbamoyladenosine biosynthesis protein TsaB